MPRTGRVINVPKPPREAFNKHRPAGTLLQAQVKHLREALVKHRAEVERLLAISVAEIRTEAEAADYAKSITALLHPHQPKQLAK